MQRKQRFKREPENSEDDSIESEEDEEVDDAVALQNIDSTEILSNNMDGENIKT